MATYVLVHGAWHGGWCWAKLTPFLRAAGHTVFTPTLTGLGERVHLLDRTVGLDTHVQDILGVLEYEDLHDVTLVGHSYGGMVITGVADRAAERLAHLVYLDAFVPRDGERMVDLLPPQLIATFREQADTAGDGWRIPPSPLERYGVTDDADLRWAGPKVGFQPLLSFEQPVRCASPAAVVLPRTYIVCTDFPRSPFARFAEHARADAAWRCQEIPTGHDAMVTMPRQLADLLLEAVVSPSPSNEHEHGGRP